jgi:TPR repeat protein
MNTHTVEELYRLAQQGNTEALTRLGICYKNGTGTAVDHSAAAQCFYSAANAGNAEAQYQLGICYEEGIGLEQDMSAASVIRRSAMEISFTANGFRK